MLTALAAVHAAHDDPAWTIDEVGLAVRRWIGEQTFVLDDDDSPADGVHLLDDQAARYGDFDDVAIVGLVETGMAGAAAAQHLLSAGAAEVARLAVGEGSPRGGRRAVSRSAGVGRRAGRSSRPSRSTTTRSSRGRCSSTRFHARGCRRWPRAPFDEARVFIDEALSLEPLALDPFDGEPRAWAELRIRAGRRRMRRTSTARCATRRSRAWSVSAHRNLSRTARSSSSRSTC